MCVDFLPLSLAISRSLLWLGGIVASPQSLLCCWEYEYKYQHVSEEGFHRVCVRVNCRPKTTSLIKLRSCRLTLRAIGKKLDCNILVLVSFISSSSHLSRKTAVSNNSKNKS